MSVCVWGGVCVSQVLFFFCLLQFEKEIPSKLRGRVTLIALG